MLQEHNTVLRPLSLNDLDAIMVWINDRDVNHYIQRVAPITREAEAAWITALSTAHNKIVFGICAIDEDRMETLIGTCGLHNIDWINRSAEAGIAIGIKKYWEKKIGTSAARLLLRYAFHSLNLHRISAHVYAFNPRSLALLKRCGFIEEGRVRDGVYRNGRYHEIINVGLLRTTYDE